MPTGPPAPAGAIIGPPVKADADADKWNPYSDEGRINQALFGAEPPWQDPLAPYGPAMASIGVSLVPGLNSYMVLTDPEASTAGKVFAVGSDVLSVVGVGTVLKLGAKGGVLGKGLIRGTKVAEGVIVAEEATLGSGRAYSMLFEMRMESASDLGVHDSEQFPALSAHRARFGRGRPRGGAPRRARTGGGHQIPALSPR